MVFAVAQSLAVGFDVALDELGIEGYRAMSERNPGVDSDCEWVVIIQSDDWKTTCYIPSAVIKEAMAIARRELRGRVKDALEGII